MKYIFDTNVIFVKKNINEYIRKNIEYKLKGSILKIFKDGNGFLSPTIFSEIINQVLIEKSKVSIWPIQRDDIVKYEGMYDELIEKLKSELEEYVLRDFQGHHVAEILIDDLSFFNDKNNFRNVKDRVISYEASFIKKEYKWKGITIVTDNIKDFTKHPKDIDHVITIKQFDDIIGELSIEFKKEGDLFGYIITRLGRNLLDGSIDFTEYIRVSHSESELKVSTNLGEFSVSRNVPLTEKDIVALSEKINAISIYISLDVDERNKKSLLEHKQQIAAEERAERYREYQEEIYDEYQESLYEEYQERLYEEYQERKREEENEAYEQGIADMYG